MKEYTAEDACFLYWKAHFKTTKGINIRRFSDFTKQKEDVRKWACFEKTAYIANQYGIILEQYIPMIAKTYEGKGFFHPKLLFALSNLQIWEQRNTIAEQMVEYQTIFERFLKSFRFVLKMCVDNNLPTIDDYLRLSIEVKKLGLHISSGRLSKYFLCMLPDGYLMKIRKNIEPDIADQLDNLVIKHKEVLALNTYRAIHDIQGIEFGNMINVINANIVKNLKKDN